MSQLTRRAFVLGSAGAAASFGVGCRPGSQGRSAGGDVDGTSSTSASSVPEDAAAPSYWPPASGEWASIDPADAGWHPERLEAAVTLAGDRASQSLLVLSTGRILAERAWGVGPGFQRDVASCQKSVVGIHVVQARDRALLDVDDPVTEHLGPGWSNAEAADEEAITIRHLLSMTSGLDDGLRRRAAPGTTWAYVNNAYYVLRHVLEAATGVGIDELSRAWLLAQLGAADSGWYQRPGPPDPKGRPIWGLSMSARDMGRVGLVVERGGSWDGAVVVEPASLAWLLGPSQQMNPAYAHLWWRNAGQATPLVPGAPPDLVAALGRHDQKIYVTRELELVVARLGEQGGSPVAADPSSFNAAWWGALAAAAPA